MPRDRALLWYRTATPTAATASMNSPPWTTLLAGASRPLRRTRIENTARPITAAARGPSEQRVDQQDYDYEAGRIQAHPVDAGGEGCGIDDRQQSEGGHDGGQRVCPPPEQGRQQRQRHHHRGDPPDQVLPEHSFEHRHRDQRADQRPVPPHSHRRVRHPGLGPQRTSCVPEHDLSVEKRGGLRIGRKNGTRTVRMDEPRTAGVPM